MGMGFERLQSCALFTVILVVAVHHRELAAPHHHRTLQETAREADVMPTSVPQATVPAASLKQLVEEVLWEALDQKLGQKLDQKIDATVHDPLAALEKREAESRDALREQVRTIGRDCTDEAARTAGEERGQRKVVAEMDEKVKMLEQHTKALQAQVDELKRLRASDDDDERRRMQRTGTDGGTAHIIIRGTQCRARRRHWGAVGDGRRWSTHATVGPSQSA